MQLGDYKREPATLKGLSKLIDRVPPHSGPKTFMHYMDNPLISIDTM